MTLLFVGGSSHTPNVTALRWFTEHVIPELPQVRMVVVGDWRPQLRQPLLGAGLDFVGTVSDQELRALSTGVDAHVAPLTAGAGLKSKVIDALASGVPLAASSVAMAGMPTPWDLAVRADDVHEWSRALDWIAARPSEVAAMTGRATKFVHDRHGRDAYLTATSALLEPVD